MIHIKIASETGYEAALKLKSGAEASAYVWQPGGTSDLRLYVGGADRVHVDANGNVGVGTTDPASIFHVNGSSQFSIALFDENTNIGDTHFTCVGDCGPGGANATMTLTLPVSTNDMAGRVYIFKRTDTGGPAPGGSKLIIDRNGKMIDGGNVDFEMNNNGECVTMQCASAAGGWIILSHYVPI